MIKSLLIVLLVPMIAFGMETTSKQEIQSLIENGKFEKKVKWCERNINKYRIYVNKYKKSSFYNWKLEFYLNKCSPILESYYEGPTIQNAEAEGLRQRRHAQIIDRASRQIQQSQ